MGQRIQNHALTIDAVLCSPAERTRLTLSRMTPYLQISPDQISMVPDLYHASLRTLTEIISEQHARSLMLIGHNPGLGELSRILSRGEIIHFPTCALALFQFSFQQWSEFKLTEQIIAGSSLALYEFPKMFVSK